jgi:polyhydroxyalkanoate synthesis repressor PhaR
MPIVKRYPNRKLYDTAARQYVSLEAIADMIRRGESVQVVDHVTGDDYTALILTQIIVEQEKRGIGSLPLEVLTGLIQAGENTLTGLRHRLSTSLDVLRQVDEEIQGRIEQLVRMGELAEEEGRRLAARMAVLGAEARAGRAQEEAGLENALLARGILTREDFTRLSAQVDQLAAKVNRLHPGPRR